MKGRLIGSDENLPAEFAGFWARHPYRSLRIDGAEWRYIDTGGPEPAILMLPGGSYRPDNYFRLISDLAHDFRVIAPAYPPVHPMRRVLTGLVALLDELRLPRVAVFGCSYGGYVAQAMVREFPDRVDSLILAQTATRHFAGLRIMRVFAGLFAVLPLSLIRVFTWRLWTRWFSAPPDAIEFWRDRLRAELDEMTKPQHVAGARNIVDFMSHYRPAAGWLGRWTGRVLILESQHDQAFSPEQRRELREAYPAAEVRSLDAGHTALFTDSEPFTQAIRGFVAAHPTKAPGRASLNRSGLVA